MSKKLFLNNFHLKLLAIIFMTIDHIGYHIFENLQGFGEIAHICRIIGRLSLPLFAFMIVEGVFHTRNIFKYLLRLFISAFVISGFLLIIKMGYAENIFIDLFLGASLIGTLNLPKYKKFYSFIPLTAIILLLVFSNSLPGVLVLSYNYYGVSLILGIYLIQKLGNIIHRNLAKRLSLEQEAIEEIVPIRKINNILVVVFIVLFNFACWGLGYMVEGFANLIGSFSIQIFSIFAAIFIYFYNGKRGYNAYWWKYGCYLYYPIHVAIIYMIYLLL